MALHHPRAALLALSTLLGIISFLHAYKPLIPLDQLTIEEAFLEVHLIDEQLHSANPPNMTAEQKDIRDNIYPTLGAFKPNDPLPYLYRQQLSKFRQAFSNWDQPLKPGTIEYLLTRALGQGFLYQAMINYVNKAINKDRKHYQSNKKTVSQALSALKTLVSVGIEVKKKYDNSRSWVKLKDVKKLEVAIETARDAVMAMPRVDEYEELVPGTLSSSMQSTSSGILPEESPDKPDVGASLPAAGQIEDSTAGDGGDSVGPDGVSSAGPPVVSSGGDPAGPNEQLPSGSAISISGGLSRPRKPRNKLHLLKQPYVGGPMLVLAVAAGYHLLKGHPVPSSGELYSLSTSNITHNVTSLVVASIVPSVASEGSSPFWYIILPLGGLVALTALGYGCWYCIKTGGTPPEDEAKAATEVSKRASQKSQQRSPTTGTSSST